MRNIWGLNIHLTSLALILLWELSLMTTSSTYNPCFHSLGTHLLSQLICQAIRSYTPWEGRLLTKPHLVWEVLRCWGAWYALCKTMDRLGAVHQGMYGVDMCLIYLFFFISSPFIHSSSLILFYWEMHTFPVGQGADCANWELLPWHIHLFTVTETLSVGISWRWLWPLA